MRRIIWVAVVVATLVIGWHIAGEPCRPEPDARSRVAQIVGDEED